MHEYLETHEIYSASSRLKYALALASCGERDGYITEALENSIGQQGVMSWIYGLHLLNNGFTCEEYSAQDVVNKLLSMQLSDNGWAVMGANGDIDVTAMAIQSLAPYYGDVSEVHQAVDDALNFLADKQKDYGGYASFGTDNLESTAQVLTALSSVGIDGLSDERFVKDGHSLLDGMNRYRLNDGSYSHVLDGDMNYLATMQAFYTFVAYERMQVGKSPLYVLDAVYQDEPIQTEIPVEIVAPDTEPSPDVPQIDENSDSPQPAEQEIENPISIENDTFEILNETEFVKNVSTTANTSAQLSNVSNSTTATIMTHFTDSATQINTTAFSSYLSNESTVMSSTDSVKSASSAQETTLSTTIATTTAILSAPEHPDNDGSFPVKMLLLSSVLGYGMIASIVLFIRKRRSPKNFLFVGITTAIGIFAIYFIRIQSADEYYSNQFEQKEQGSTVTITIRCDTLVGKFQSEYIPEDGIILDVTEIPISEGETVYQVLTETVQTYHIQMEHKNNAYIAGINYLYELQYGDLSGWMYRVNGEFPSVGCNEYVLHEGDSIEWLYTCNIGNDLT